MAFYKSLSLYLVTNLPKVGSKAGTRIEVYNIMGVGVKVPLFSMERALRNSSLLI